jgi:formylglycine-generating enzyme required for sulfatase activity
MASYGGYETVRELYRSGLASSFSAHRAGEAAERYTVKLYQPLVADDMSDRLQAEIDCFLDGARVQQKVASSGAQHWSAVHEVGTVEGGAFYIGDYHGRSVQQLITGRVKLSGAGLYQLIQAVVQGLSELKKACNRPHGNLKPANILLTGKGRISKARPLLADPAGAAKLDPQVGDVVDFHAIGEIIYQLVLHRTGKAMGGWPAPEGPEWDRIGKKGEQWRQLCNRLLNPNLAPNLLTFDDLLQDLQKLRQTEGIPWLIVGPVAAAVLLAGAAAVMFWPEAPPPPWGNKEAAQWKSVCTDFGNWVEPLLSDREEGRLKAWQEDPFLNSNVLPALNEVVKDANPRRIASQAWGDVFKLGDNPPDQAKSRKAIKQTEAAAAIYRTMRSYLASDKWPAYARVCSSAKAFAARGWSSQAEYLQSLQQVGDRNVAARVQAILKVQADLKRIDTLSAQVDKLVAAAQGWQAGGLKGLDEYAAAKLRGPPARAGADSIADLADRLSELQDAKGPLSRLVSYIRSEQVKRLDMALMRRHPPFAVAEGAAMTEDILRSGLVTLENGKYDTKPDPRSPAWKAQVSDALTARRGDLANLDDAIAKLLKGEAPPPADKQALDAAAAKVVQLRKSAEEVQARFADVGRQTVYNFDTREKIDQGKETIDSGLKELARSVGSAGMEVEEVRKHILRTRAATLEEYQKALRARSRVSATALAAIDEKWLAQRDVLLASETTVEGLAEKVDRLEKCLRDIEGGFQSELGAKLQQRPWNKALLTDDLDSRRQNAVASALSYVDWPKVFADQPDESFKARKDQLVANYDKWRAGLVSAVPAVNRIQDLLADGYMLDEKPADGLATVDQTYQSVKDNVVLADPAAGQLVGPILARVARLGQIAQLSGAAELLAAASAGKPGNFEAARAAWQRLGKLKPAWPASPDDLKQEVEVRKNLDTLYGLLAGDARKSVLRAELAGESRRRWQEYFLTRVDPRQIDGAIARMGDFGVSPADASLPPLAKYRLAMWDFHQQVIAAKRDLDDDAVKAAIAAFQDKVKAMPPEVSQKPELAALLAKFDELRLAKNAAIDLTKAGPGAAGWAMTEQAANTVTYTWPGRDQKLTFARVTPKSGEPCFLCTTEVSTGLFMNVVMGLGKWPQMQQAMPAADDLRGPRSWILNGGAIQVDPNWFAMIPPILVGKLYAPGLKVDVPGPLHPVQQVPVPAAAYFARLLNCRLPTSTEWQAAYEQDKASASRKAYNLRDKTWLAQKAHDIALEDSGDLVDPELFYPDAGIYWPASIPAAQRKVGRDGEAWPNPADDGVLWFAKVVDDNQRLFQNLVGNVAEYVYEDPKALADLKDPTIAQVQQLLRTGGNAKVIGGSAMSPPQVPVDQPQALANPAGKDCYSDVGFRLAFLAGRERIQTTLQKLLGGMPDEGYLPPAKP